jgi:hypothetical protein
MRNSAFLAKIIGIHCFNETGPAGAMELNGKVSFGLNNTKSIIANSLKGKEMFLNNYIL